MSWGVLRLVAFSLLVFLPSVSGCSCSDDETHEESLSVLDRCTPPALASGAVARFADAVRFIYDGPCPTQTGADKAVFDPVRVSVVRGVVTDDAGAPLEGVRVTAPSEARYGETKTRADGRFEIVVNGGDTMTLRFTRDGRLTSRRRFPLKQNRFRDLGDLVLVAPSAKTSPVTFGSNAWQVAAGETSKDTNEARTAIVLFPPGVRATARAAGGERPLEGGTLRITEFTRGERGFEAMPSTLPSSSAYTYASSFELDEARDEDISFDKPVIAYVDNFLHMNPGTIVPAGALGAVDDRWMPGDSGRIVALDDAALTAAGATPDEIATLRGVAEPGKTYMRIPLAHFSGWDFNWGFAPPFDSVFPPDAAPDDGAGSPCESSGGSWFECESRTLGEDIPIVGTGFALHYKSDRVVGRTDAMSVSIPVTPDVVPPSAKRAEVSVTVLGVTEKKTYDIAPNIIHRFTWNGKDAFDREWPGGAMAEIEVGIVYDGMYVETPTFGSWASGAGAVTGDRTRREARLTKRYEVHLGVWDQRSLGFGGWSVSPHHVYDSDSRVLYLGDGRKRVASTIGAMARSIAGTGKLGSAGDGGPAALAELSFPAGIALGRNGAIYVTENTTGHRVRKIENGTITTIAGTGSQGKGDGTGDGGPATGADLNGPRSIVVREDGSVCFSDQFANRVRCVGTDGILRTILGGGQRNVEEQAISPLEASILTPTSLAVGPDGSLFVIGSGTRGAAVFRLDPTGGRVERVAGGGPERGENIVARTAALDLPVGLAVGPDGSLYISDSSTNAVRRIDPSGRISTFAGSGEAGSAGDGGSARSAQLRGPTAVAVDLDGIVYISDQNNLRIRRVERGRIYAYAGGGDRVAPDGSALGMSSLSASGLAVSQDGGTVYASDQGAMRVFSFRSPFAGLSAGEITIPSEDGGEIFVFDPSGRHLRTLDSITLEPILTFRYENDLLTGIDDAHGNEISIMRGGDGRAGQIRAPFGQVTKLSYDGDRMLAAIEDPLARREKFRYAPGGLLVERTDPSGGVHTMAYDAGGLLEKDGTAENATFSLTSPVPGTTELRSGLGRLEIYERRGARGLDETHSVTHEDGTKSSWTNKKDGSSVVTWSDGSTLDVVREADPRLGLLAPYVRSETMKLPSGLTTTATRDWKAETTPEGALVALHGEKRTPFGQSTTDYDAASRTWTMTSRGGRISKVVLDEEGRVIRSELPGFLPLTTKYDERGRVEEIARGASFVRYHYDRSGAVSEIEDALGRRTKLERDAALRIVGETRPDGAKVIAGYSPMDDLTSLTPAGKPAHTLTWGKDGLFGSWAPPGAQPMRAAYDADRALVALEHEGGSRIDVAYDPAGRVTRYGFAGGEVAIGYDATSGRPNLFDGPQGNAIALAYDGFLVTKETVSGAVSGSVDWTYDTLFRPTSEKISGGNDIQTVYDSDGLPSLVGTTFFTRDVATGQLKNLNVGGTNSAFTQTGQGELATYVVTTPGGTPLSLAYAYDPSSRIKEKQENGVTYAYEYDLGGRLIEVKRDGVSIATYTYDANSNRTDHGITTDGSDSVVSADGVTYTYTPRGERASRTGSGGTTNYQYDGRGHLVVAGNVAYEVDAFGRRIVRRVDGAVTHRWLYSDALRIAAEVDAAGAVLTRFVYSRRQVAPDAMIRGATTYLLARDHLGSVRFVIDAASGAVAQELEYDAYGVVLKDTNPGFQPFGFAGGIYDATTRLVHFGAREYDPEVGAFTRRDPTGLDGGPNIYTYTAGDPVNFVDRTGNFIGAAIVGAVEGGIVEGAVEGANQALDPDRAGIDCGAIAAAAGKGAAAGAISAAVGSALGRSLSRNAGRQCFAPGTKVATERGPVPIEDIAVGERVLSPDDSGEVSYREVTRLFRRVDAERVSLTFTNDDGATDTIVTTPEHPFGVATSGWVSAADLAVGDVVVTAEGSLARLSVALSLERRGEVFNLEVAGTHTYFVGASELWVHNSCTGNGGNGKPPPIKPGVKGEPGEGRYIPKATKNAVDAENPSNTCVFCGRAGKGTHYDHADPFSKGGSSKNPENIQKACDWCNKSKGNGDYPKNPPPSYGGPWPPDHW